MCRKVEDMEIETILSILNLHSLCIPNRKFRRELDYIKEQASFSLEKVLKTTLDKTYSFFYEIQKNLSSIYNKLKYPIVQFSTSCSLYKNFD